MGEIIKKLGSSTQELISVNNLEVVLSELTKILSRNYHHWGSDMAFGGNRIRYNAHVLGYQSLQEILGISGGYSRKVFVKDIGEVEFYISITPWSSNPDTATVLVGVNLDEETSESVRQKVYGRFLEHLKKSGEKVYAPSGITGENILRILSEQEKEPEDKLNYIKERLDLVKDAREIIAMNNETCRREHYSIDKRFPHIDEQSVIIFEGNYGTEDNDKIQSYLEQKLGNPARILLTELEQIGILKENQQLFSHQSAFTRYIAAEENQTLFVDKVSSLIAIYARLIENPNGDSIFQAGVFFDLINKECKKLEQKVLKYFKNKLSKDVPFSYKEYFADLYTFPPQYSVVH